MNHFLEKTIKDLNEKMFKRRLDYHVQFSGEEDAEYREKIYKIIKEKKDEIKKLLV